MDISQLLRESYLIAESLSDDPVTRNGAVVVRGEEIIGRGANRIPRNVDPTPDRLERPSKYNYLIHAEQDAIANAAFQGNATDGATVVCPWAACTSCARLIIQSGIRSLIVHKHMHDRTPQRWHEEIEKAIEMLNEAGVAYHQYDCIVGGATNLFNGEVWSP